MQAIKGYLFNGWFSPIDDVELPSRTEAVLVFDEAPIKAQPAELFEFKISESEKQARIDWLNRIENSLELSMDEDLSNFPKQGLMKVSYDDWRD